MNNWTQIAQVVKDKMAEKEPQISIRDVMNWFELASPSTAEYYLNKLQDMGAVKWIAGRWFLKW